jgi:hypothetical protein
MKSERMVEKLPFDFILWFVPYSRNRRPAKVRNTAVCKLYQRRGYRREANLLRRPTRCAMDPSRGLRRSPRAPRLTKPKHRLLRKEETRYVLALMH